MELSGWRLTLAGWEMAENGFFGEISFRDVGGFCLGVLSGVLFGSFLHQGGSRAHHGELAGWLKFLRGSVWRGLVISVGDVY